VHRLELLDHGIDILLRMGSALDDGGRDEDQELFLGIYRGLGLEEPAQDRDVAQPRHLGDDFLFRVGDQPAQHTGLAAFEHQVGHDGLGTNPGQEDLVLAVAADRELVETGHELWNIPDRYPTPRNAEEIANTVLPLMRLSHNAVMIEPHFDPNKRRFRRTLAAILATCNENVCGRETIQVELHTSIDRFFEGWERGEFRDLDEETKVYQYYVSECQSRLPPLIPKGVEFKVIVCKQRTDGEKLHNRYLLTNIYGVIFGTGSDESENPDSKESDDIILLEEGQYFMRYKQYTGTPPAFDRVGEPIPIASTET